MKKITFRAECWVDIVAFFHLLMYNDVPFDKLPNELGEIKIDTNTFVCSFMVSDEADINYFKNLSSNIIDNHRICQTMAYGNTTNEDWSFNDFTKLYDVKTPVKIDGLIKSEKE